MKKEKSKSARPAGEKKVRVSIKSPEGRFMGSVKIDAQIWREANEATRSVGATVDAGLEAVLRDAMIARNALLGGKAVAA